MVIAFQQRLLAALGWAPAHPFSLYVKSGFYPERVVPQASVGLQDGASSSIAPASYPDDLVNLDPQFLDVSNGDYHLQSGSSAINAGLDAGVTADRDGISRPQGGGFDIGAYEFAPALSLRGKPLISAEFLLYNFPNSSLYWWISGGRLNGSRRSGCCSYASFD